jgi:predicted RNase H-like HicB family nuclease
MKYQVFTWKEEQTWTAHAPSIPGVYGLGHTRASAKNDLEQALKTYSDYLLDVGE